MFNDPWYGLNDYRNYGHWQALMYTDDPKEKQIQKLWYWELSTYFRLTFGQTEVFQKNWNKYFDAYEQELYDDSPEPYNNLTGFASS